MKIAIFVEGLTEAIFVTELLREYFNPGTIQVESTKLLGRKTTQISLRALGGTQQYGEHFCLIIDASNDETVLSKLRENYKRMRAEGYIAFFGLRDLKSKAFKEIGERIIQGALDTVDGFKKQNDVFFHFAKMETEAWFLAEPGVFERIASRLTLETIEQETGLNLEELDPQEEIRNPATAVRRIHRIAGLHYRKQKKEVYRLVSRLDWDELCVGAKAKSHISFFFDFLNDLERVLTTPNRETTT